MWFFKSSVPIADSGILHGMTDCHSHLLPGVDDGVKTEEETWRIFALKAKVSREGGIGFGCGIYVG